MKTLRQPVPYKHPSGAVIWVSLDHATASAVLAQLDGHEVSRINSAKAIDAPARKTEAPRPDLHGSASLQVPVASDGTWFGPHLLRAGQFTVGEKGQEVRFDSFKDALTALGRMDVPRWRRWNKAGNWGIVSGTRWTRLEDLSDKPPTK